MFIHFILYIYIDPFTFLPEFPLSVCPVLVGENDEMVIPYSPRN